MAFHQLCTFETFQQVSGRYGYGENFRDVIEQEFTRIKGNDCAQSWAAAVVTEPLAVNRCFSSVVNRDNIPGSCSSYFVSRVCAEGLLPGHYKQSVWWDKSHKIPPSVTAMWLFFIEPWNLKASPFCFFPPNRKPPQPQPQQQTHTWHGGPGQVQVKSVHALKSLNNGPATPSVGTLLE